MKADFDLLEFRRTDFPPAFVEQAATAIADYFSQGREYVPQYCALIGQSRRWTISTLTKELDKFGRKFASLPGNAELYQIVYDAFKQCSCQDDIDSLRGAMLEALVLASYGGSTKLGPQLGWGAKSYLRDSHGRKQVIRYTCSCNPIPDGCGNRATVDIGYWNGFSASLYECKVHPKHIGCKEVKYMEEVSTKLSRIKVHHTYYFVVAAPDEEAEIRFAELGLDAKINIVPIGYQRIYQKLKPPVERLS